MNKISAGNLKRAFEKQESIYSSIEHACRVGYLMFTMSGSVVQREIKARGENVEIVCSSMVGYAGTELLSKKQE